MPGKMSKSKQGKIKWRSLLTETLPYEVPVIFSNEVLYASLSARTTADDVSSILKKLRSSKVKFTIPYAYHIAKDETKTTALGIIHPNHQLKISEFYEGYSQSIIDYCNRSDMSLRRPISELPLFSSGSISKEPSFKLGVPHIDPDEGEIDIGHLSSYFSYGKYNLLGRFVDSEEFRRLEKRYKFLKTIDVTKCFFNLYTHSISWSVKGKSFSKEQSDVYSFEYLFDKIMQKSNYNETNGIVVGPEVSRIFAEIIFQSIDQRVSNSLIPLIHEKDYAVRRYVDDYFIFSNNQSTLERTTRIIEIELEFFKLFINRDKTLTSTRPFVSNISLARSELAVLIGQMHELLDDAPGDGDPKRLRKKVQKLKSHSLNIRLLSERYKVSFSALSGWLLTTMTALLQRLISSIKLVADDSVEQALVDMASAILEITFYICALDLRVGTTYKLCQMLSVTNQISTLKFSDSYDRLMHIVSEELNGLIRAFGIVNIDENNDLVELYNLLIIGAHYIGADFLRSSAAHEALKDVLASPRITYFSYITAKFCYLKDSTAFSIQLSLLNSRVRKFVDDNHKDFLTNTELYLFICDYLSAPDVPVGDKRTLVILLCGGQPSKALTSVLVKHLGFADWTGVRIEHVLARKELRPVYAWA